jgi:hypothetical protein
MRTTRLTPVFIYTLWGLLSLWMVLGGLEFVEELHSTPETIAEDVEGKDLDEEALLQLALAIKPVTPDLTLSANGPVISQAMASTSFLSPKTVRTLAQREFRGPPSLPLQQQLSVYRI